MQIPSGALDLVPLIPAVAILVFGLIRIVKSPIGNAIADRIRGSHEGEHEEVALLREEVAELRDELEQVHERLEFAERLLIRGNEKERTRTPE